MLVVLTLAILFVRPAPPLLKAGVPAPAIRLRDATGSLVAAVPSSGHRPVVVAFFEIRCTTCQDKAADLCRLATSHPDVSVVAVDSGEGDARAARTFAQNHIGSCPVPFLLDPDLTVSRRYAAVVVPVVYVVDSNGNIAYGGAGGAALDTVSRHIPSSTGG